MANRYEDRERYEGGRSQHVGRQGEFEPDYRRRNLGPGGQNQGGNRDEATGGRESERYEDRYNDRGQYGSDYDERSGSSDGGYDSGNRSFQNERERAADWDRSRERSMTTTYPRRNEWSSGSGVGTGLGGAENSEYSHFTGSSSYYGGGSQGQYGGGMSQYGRPGMGGFGREYERSEGQHVGRGPKGYKRSDERIKEDVNERLTQDPHIDASEVEVQVKDGEVTLSGTVDNRSAKRRAEDIIENLSGVREVHNQLRVQTSQPEIQSSSQSRESRDSKTSSHSAKS